MNNRIINNNNKPFDKSKRKCDDKGTSAMNNSDNNNLYAMAFKLVYDKLPRWKQVAVDEGIKFKKVNDSVLDEFVSNVIRLAENNLIIEDVKETDNKEDNEGTKETCCGK